MRTNYGSRDDKPKQRRPRVSSIRRSSESGSASTFEHRTSEHRSFEHKDRKPFERREGGSSSYGHREGGSRTGGSSFGHRDGGSSSYGHRDGGSSSYGHRDGGSRTGGSSYGHRDGGSSSYGHRDGGSRTGGSSFGHRDGGSSSYGHRDGGSRSFEHKDRKPFERREGGSSSFGHREGGSRTGGSSFGHRDGGSRSFEHKDRKPFERRDGGSSSYGHRDSGSRSFEHKDRKPFERREGGSRSFGHRDGGRSFGSKPSRPTYNRTPNVNSNPNEVRLNKFIANSGVCSRREADDYITAGLVTVNGEVVVTLGTRVKLTDDIRFNGERLKGEKKVYIIMNKPKDYVTTTSDPHADQNVMDLISPEKCSERIFPVGRLDKSTTGVLLFTNDGALTETLTHPSYNRKKIYQVSLGSKLKKSDFDKLLTGIELEDGLVVADALSYIDGDEAEIGIEIHSGRNRVIRRMFEFLGYKVKKLDRVYFAGLTKQKIRRGQWRFLTNQEIGMLNINSNE